MQEKNFGQGRLRVFEQLDAADSLNKYRYFSRLRSRGARTRRTKSEGDKGLPRGLWGWANAGAGRGMYWLKGRRVAYSAVHRSTLASPTSSQAVVCGARQGYGLRSIGFFQPAPGEARNEPGMCPEINRVAFPHLSIKDSGLAVLDSQRRGTAKTDAPSEQNRNVL